MSRPNFRTYITVVDVFTDLGFEPIPDDTWAVGAAVRELYKSAMGQSPMLELRKKTNGPGSHCFAVYPPHWRPKIEEIVRSVAKRRDNQLKLF
jgi:hypothetical protein